jgi:hypothetical protein
VTPDQIRDYAATLIIDHARKVEYLTITELAGEQYDLGAEGISEQDADAVNDLITKATVVVSWPGDDEYRQKNPNWRAFWTDHHAYAFDAGLRALAPQSPTGAGGE